MAIISRSLLLFLFQGALYWICIQPERIEPYFVSFAVLFILFFVYAGSYGAVPELRLNSLKLKKVKPDAMPILCYDIKNIGDGEARNIHIETRINMTIKKKGGESFSVQIPSRVPRAFLSYGKIMRKKFSFFRRMSAQEINMIEKGTTILSAYTVVYYKDEKRKKPRELRVCSVYDPKTQCFEKTFGFCAGEDWPNTGVSQPLTRKYAGC